MQWTAFLQLENCSENNNLLAKTKDIWTLPIEERLAIFNFNYHYNILLILFISSVKKGYCIASLKISKAVKDQGSRYYLHTMEKSNKSTQNNFKLTNFSVNNYLVVSTNNRNAISTGFISALTETTVDLLLDR